MVPNRQVLWKNTGIISRALGPSTHRFLFVFGTLGTLLFSACQQAPTKAITETVNPLKIETVLLDTRTALEFESFHISGSTHIWSQDFTVRSSSTYASEGGLKRSKSKAVPKVKFELDALDRVIERLANRGVAPDRDIVLIGSQKDSVENLKWEWLLKNLEIRDVRRVSLNEARTLFPGRRARPESVEPWKLQKSEELQKEFILRLAPKCFIEFSKKDCV